MNERSLISEAFLQSIVAVCTYIYLSSVSLLCLGSDTVNVFGVLVCSMRRRQEKAKESERDAHVIRWEREQGTVARSQVTQNM